MQLKPETLLLGLMNKQLEKNMELFLYMTAVRLLYAQRCRDSTLPRMVEWIVKMMALAEMARLASLIREYIILNLLLTGNHLRTFWMKLKKMMF